MNEIKIFENAEFGKVRTMVIGEKPYFAGSDVAKVLGYTNPQKAIRDHCKGVTKRSGVSLTTNQHGVTTEQITEMSFISESDVYRLVMRSKLPNAERFQDWVVEEVLPSIRKHGAYMTAETIEAVADNPDLLIRLAQNLKAEREKAGRLEAKIQADAGKVQFADAVADSGTMILVGELAKILKGNGVDIGQNRLFEELRQRGFLISRRGTDYNMPTQKAMELGLFRIKETAITHSDGHTTVSKTAKVTGKGQQYFISLFLSPARKQLIVYRS